MTVLSMIDKLPQIVKNGVKEAKGYIGWPL